MRRVPLLRQKQCKPAADTASGEAVAHFLESRNSVWRGASIPGTIFCLCHWLRQCRIAGIRKHWQSQWHPMRTCRAATPPDAVGGLFGSQQNAPFVFIECNVGQPGARARRPLRLSLVGTQEMRRLRMLLRGRRSRRMPLAGSVKDLAHNSPKRLQALSQVIPISHHVPILFSRSSSGGALLVKLDTLAPAILLNNSL